MILIIIFYASPVIDNVPLMLVGLTQVDYFVCTELFLLLLADNQAQGDADNYIVRVDV